MKAVILAGGLGTRISEETSIRQKPLVEIGGKPDQWHLDQSKIGTCPLFAGSMKRQPYLTACNYRVGGELANDDKVMKHAYWIGAYPALSEKMPDFVVQKIEAFFGVNVRQWSPGATR